MNEIEKKAIFVRAFARTQLGSSLSIIRLFFSIAPKSASLT